MARIPTAANVGQAPSPRDPGVSVPAIGQEVARGIRDIGQGFAQIAEKQQIAEDSRFLADYDSAVRTRTAEAVLGLDGQQESSTYASQVEQSVAQIGPSVLKEFETQGYTPSQQARARAGAGFTGLLTSTHVSAMTDQHNAKVAAALRGIQDNADLHVNTLRDNPTKDALAATLEQLNDVFSQAEGMANPNVVASVRSQYQGMAYTAFTEGLISRNRLGEARAVLRTDAANDALDPKAKSALARQVDALIRQRDNAAKSNAKALLGVETSQALQVILNKVQNSPSPSSVDQGLSDINTILENVTDEFTPAQLAELKQSYSSGVWSRYVDGLVASGQYVLAEDVLQSEPATNTMTSRDMDAAHTTLGRAQAARQNKLEGIAKSSVDGVKKVVLGGQLPDTTEAWQDVAKLPEDQQAMFASQLLAWEAVAKQFAGVAVLPAAERAKIRADVVRAQGSPVTSQSAEYYAALTEVLNDADAQQKRDATVLAIRAGVPPSETEFDLQDPNTYEPLASLAGQTVALYGLEAQVLPLAAFNSIKQALAKDSTNAEGHAAIDALSKLSPPALQATLGQLGDTASPAIRHAVSLARTNPQLAKALVDASHVDSNVPRPTNKDLLEDSDINTKGTQAFSGPLQGLFYDSLEAAKTLAASRVLTTGGDAADLTEATITAFDEMYEGLLVQVNGSYVLLPSELRDTSASPTVRRVEDTLPRLETPEDQSKVLVPTAQGRPVPLPKGAKFQGLFYPGTEDKVPWSKFASSPMGQPIGPGVYAPRVDGSTQGHVVGRYTFKTNGVEVTHDFPVALSLPATLNARPTGTPDNVRLLQDQIRALQASGRTATPEFRDAVERLKELRGAEGASGQQEEREFLASATPQSSDPPAPRVRPEQLASDTRAQVESMADGEFVLQVTAGASGLARFGLSQVDKPMAEVFNDTGEALLGEFISGRPEQIAALNKIDSTGTLAKRAAAYSKRTGKTPGSVEMSRSMVEAKAKAAAVPVRFAQRYTLQHELVHKGLQDLWLHANRPDTPELPLKSDAARAFIYPKTATDYLVAKEAHHIVTEAVAVKALLDSTNGQDRQDLGYAMRLIDSFRGEGAGPVYLAVAIAMEKAETTPGYQLDEAELEAMERVYRGLDVPQRFWELAPPQALFDAMVELESKAKELAQ